MDTKLKGTKGETMSKGAKVLKTMRWVTAILMVMLGALFVFQVGDLLLGSIWVIGSAILIFMPREVKSDST